MKTVFVILAVLLGTAFAKVWYVHPDSVRNHIRPCLDSCAAGDTILVAKGTYHERLTWPNKQAIKLLSESGPDSTIIDADSAGAVVTISIGVDSTTAIEGFTITGGCSGLSGGGVDVTYGGPMIRNNTVTGNLAYLGGAVSVVEANSVYLVNNRLTRNHASGWGGAVVAWGGSAYIIGNLFERNLCDSNAGAVYFQSAGLVQGNMFNANRSEIWWGALNCWGATAPVIGNTFTHDSAPHGGAMAFINCSPAVSGNSVRSCWSLGPTAVTCHQADPTFVDDTFADNKCGLDGAVCARNGSRPHFRRCFVDSNQVGGNSGAFLCCDSSKLWIDSCCIAGNTAAGVYVQRGADAVISNSNIIGNVGCGVNCEWYAESVDARNNWWGDADNSGPFHPDSNPTGHGDTVADGVFFRPWLADSVVIGLAEYFVRAPVSRPERATVVRGVLQLPSSLLTPCCSLLSIDGRKLLDLQVGANDVSDLAPGVYFLRRASCVERDMSRVTKVVIAR